MSDERLPESGPLQFERAEFQQPQAASCSQCKEAIADSYYEVDGAITCDACRRRREFERDHVSTSRRLVRSIAFGGFAGAVGAALYWGISAATGYEFGLIAIVVGLMVGVAVRAGSYGKGGWLYQAVAMALTYAAIVSTYVPDVARSLMGSSESTEPLGLFGNFMLVIIAFGFALVVPMLGGLDNLIGLIIIGIGLYEAWKINKRSDPAVSGPYRLGERSAAEPPSG